MSRRSVEFRSIAERAEQDETLIMEDYLGEMSVKCLHCLSLNFLDEKTGSQAEEFSRCCQKGQIKLEPMQPYPEYLKSLMTFKLPESNNFMTNIRSYNSSCSFASTGANIKAPPGHGPYCFRVCGSISHRAGTILPDENEPRKFAQLYILDPDQAAIERMMLKENRDCTEYIMKNLAKVLEANPWVRTAKMLHEVEKEAIADAERLGVQPTKVMLAILQDPKSDPRRYNAPVVNEVAVVFQNQDGEPPFERDIIIHMRKGSNSTPKYKRINILNQNLDALTYPIFFPNGEKGWHTEIQRIKKKNQSDPEKKSRVRVSMREYFSYRFSVRDEFNPVLSGGKLTQQMFVDCYVRAESNDLKYIRDNQAKLRSDKYSVLKNLANADNTSTSKPGKAVILPSSFQGSPRNMQQNYLDAMAIMAKFGKPSLFVTMTCNPKWKEITENLDRWQKAEHRPDLVARVFNLKLKHLLEDICHKDKLVFGKVVAKIHVIEFQKRGLPHAHILIILEDKIDTSDEIDRIVRAEIPDPETSPRLFEIVTRTMIHTPCNTNPSAPCRTSCPGKIKCSKGFPKEFQPSTNADFDGYPKYKRREQDKLIVGDRIIDNSWVVPYNPFLSLKYNCHVNVEVCASIRSVKYLFKYVYKGHDCADLTVNEKSLVIEHDETRDYVDTRYVSAPEAIWRIFGMRMHDQSHSICRLDIHLPDEQTIYFLEGNESEAVHKAKEKDTKLIRWFNLNLTDETAREYRYWEIPAHFVWKGELAQWKRRKQGGDKVIGRMYSVNFKDQERYYLRLLLSHAKGATSFADLRTVNKDDHVTVYETFYEAAKALGFVLDDTTWQDTLDEAKAYQLPCQLRQLYACICALGNPSDPLKLWNDNKLDMIEDFCHRIHNSEGECIRCEQYALKEIKDALIVQGKDYAQYRLPEISASLPDLNSVVYNLATETRKANEMFISLNNEQKLIFDKIIAKVNDNSIGPKCFFLDGPGGSGKTYLYKTFLHYFRSRNEIVLPAASTGIAANILPGGRTYHSLYKLPIPITETTVSTMKLSSRDAEAIRNAKLLIIDECTMASSHALNSIDFLLREVMNMDRDGGIPFGGKVMLLGGDFRQCLTIVPHAQRPAIVQACLKHCKAWSEGYFEKLSLVTNMRAEDPSYSEWLLTLGNGTLGNDAGLGDDVVEIPSQFICEGSIVQEIFGDQISEDMILSTSRRAILCPKNSDVDRINDEIISLIDGDYRTYFSSDEVDSPDEQVKMNYPIEFLNTVKLSGWPPHQLKLKKGTIIMLLRNLNTKKDLCNGTRLVIKEMQNNVILAFVLTDSGLGDPVLIPRIDLQSSETDLPFILKRRQFPIKPAFAMTINKSQGQTLDKVGIYLSEPVFGHGQLYVAFSRVRRECDVKVKVLNTSEQGQLIEGSERVFTKNVVFKEVFTLNDKNLPWYMQPN